MMSGVPGPPPGGGNQIHLHQAQNVTSSTMLDMKTEPGHFKPEHKPDHIKMEFMKVNYKPPPLNANGTVHGGNMHDDGPTIKSENIQAQPHTIPHMQPTTNRPIQPAIRSNTVQRILVQGGQSVRPSVHPPSIASPAPPNSSSVGLAQQIRTTVPTNASGAPILSPEDQSTVQKCKNFLMTLIQLAQRNEQANPQTVHNVKELVQQLIDNSITAEAFTERLQTELQSSPQPYLVPFLRKSLPLLRRSMHQSNQTTNPNPPARTVVSTPRPPPMVTQPPPQTRTVMPVQPPTGNRIVVRPIRNPMPTGVPRINLKNTPVPPTMTRPPRNVRPAPNSGRAVPGPPSKIAAVDRNEERDDDITDVTAMADVDLTYESKNLSTSAEIGTEIRGAPGGDKATSVNESVLHKLVGQAASRSGGIDRVTPDGARLIGLALEEYIKSLVSKAIHAASHRTIQFKESEHREKVSDVKNQFKFLHELMMMERTQAEEAEQEQRSKLLRSRNKKEDDPDREKKKKDAKMKQQALQEAEQQKQADETALEASRRKPRSANAPASSIQSGNNPRTTRICRVKIRDVLFCLESEKLDRNSRDEMFKRYLK